jgi:hypothetical protein
MQQPGCFSAAGLLPFGVQPSVASPGDIGDTRVERFVDLMVEDA